MEYEWLLEGLPEQWSALTNLKILRLSTSCNLRALPQWLSELTGLTHLELHTCSSLVSLPDCFGTLSNLRHLHIDRQVLGSCCLVTWRQMSSSASDSRAVRSVLEHSQAPFAANCAEDRIFIKSTCFVFGGISSSVIEFTFALELIIMPEMTCCILGGFCVCRCKAVTVVKQRSGMVCAGQPKRIGAAHLLASVLHPAQQPANIEVG